MRLKAGSLTGTISFWAGGAYFRSRPASKVSARAIAPSAGPRPPSPGGVAGEGETFPDVPPRGVAVGLVPLHISLQKLLHWLTESRFQLEFPHPFQHALQLGEGKHLLLARQQLQPVGSCLLGLPLLHPDHGLAVQGLQTGRLQLQSLLEMHERWRQFVVLQAELAYLGP